MISHNTCGHDAPNRISQIAHGDQTIAFTWDACPNGLGRLCGVTDGSGGTAFDYDLQGRVLRGIKGAWVELISHNDHDHDALNRVTRIAHGDQTITVAWVRKGPGSNLFPLFGVSR